MQENKYCPKWSGNYSTLSEPCKGYVHNIQQQGPWLNDLQVTCNIVTIFTIHMEIYTPINTRDGVRSLQCFCYLYFLKSDDFNYTFYWLYMYKKGAILAKQLFPIHTVFCIVFFSITNINFTVYVTVWYWVVQMYQQQLKSLTSHP